MKTKSSRFQTGWQVALLIALWVGTLSAQSSLIEVQAKVDKAEITIGDRITYTLIIDRAKNVQIKSPGQGTNLGMFEIKDYQFHQPVEKNNRIIEQYDYVISVYDTGKFVIPPFPIGFLASDTTTRYQFISSQPIEIHVSSVVNDENATLQDIKAPLTIAPNYWLWAGIALGVLLLIALVIFLIWYFRKRKEGQPIFRKEVIRPAHEIALEALDDLLKTDWLVKQEFKRFYEELSFILRRYLEQRFYIRAMEETTTEILNSLLEVNVGMKHQDMAKQVLELSDLVKFAKYIPDGKETQGAIQSTRELIEQTRLEFETVEREVAVETPVGESGVVISSDGKPTPGIRDRKLPSPDEASDNEQEEQT